MFIIKFQGGLGNQMFQYALYKKLETMGNIVKADLSRYCIDKGTKREFCLEKYFKVIINRANDDEIKRLYAGNNQYIKRAIIKRVGKKTYYREQSDKMRFCDSIFNMSDGYLEGFWQSEKYFIDIEKTIKECFSLDTSSVERRQNTVAVHVRMGDYLDAKYKDIYGNICTKDYYHNAIRLIREKTENPCFIVFSDDISKARDLLVEEDGLMFAKSDEVKSEIDDMLGIVNCNHQIIANSSYSWWGAWLNPYPNKIVIAPKKWMNSSENDDVVPDSWVRL